MGCFALVFNSVPLNVNSKISFSARKSCGATTVYERYLPLANFVLLYSIYDLYTDFLPFQCGFL